MKLVCARSWRLALAAALVPVVIAVPPALASQGPGGGPGTAGPATQFVMGIIVYGGSAAIILAGLGMWMRRRS